MKSRPKKNPKDHLGKSDIESFSSVSSSQDVRSFVHEDPLFFLTHHDELPCPVDLRVFARGESERVKSGKWAGGFSPRAELIHELAPAIQDCTVFLRPKSISHYISMLRAWWRLFDRVEALLPSMSKVASAADITDVHRIHAIDCKMSQKLILPFLRVVNITRIAKRLRPLYWDVPQDEYATTKIPVKERTDLVRHALKHQWFRVLRRWEAADQWRVDPECRHDLTEEEIRLRDNTLFLEKVIASSGKARPAVQDAHGSARDDFYRRGLQIGEMLRSKYPDGNDIRTAFHLCLVTTGWNPAVLIDIDVTDNFLEEHPMDPARYILRSTKARAGGREETSEGLFKTQRGAGFIIRTLVKRTEPLRAELRRDLEACKQQLDFRSGLDEAALTKLVLRIAELEKGVRSVWLFAAVHLGNVQWLTNSNFSAQSGNNGRTSFMHTIISSVNKHLAPEKKVPLITASGLRKVFGNDIYLAAGGSVLAVMKALGHVNLRTTSRYLNNTALVDVHRNLYSMFSESLWTELQTTGRVDPTILAHRVRKGAPDATRRQRLSDYRTLLVSRIGVQCKDPYRPPAHIGNGGVADRESAPCHVQRCLLCVENAVITPESLPGLCKREAELMQIKSQMNVRSFQESSFREELVNTEIVLEYFDKNEVEKWRSHWGRKITNGWHRVSDLDGEIGGIHDK